MPDLKKGYMKKNKNFKGKENKAENCKADKTDLPLKKTIKTRLKTPLRKRPDLTRHRL